MIWRGVIHRGRHEGILQRNHTNYCESCGCHSSYICCIWGNLDNDEMQNMITYIVLWYATEYSKIECRGDILLYLLAFLLVLLVWLFDSTLPAVRCGVVWSHTITLLHLHIIMLFLFLFYSFFIILNSVGPPSYLLPQPYKFEEPLWPFNNLFS